MSELDLWGEICETKRLMDLALVESKTRGRRMNETEAHYYTVKDIRVRELLDENKSGTVIQMVIKGEQEVNEAMRAFHDAQVEYKNACEAVNVYKKWLDTLREQYQREWGQAGRDNQ